MQLYLLQTKPWDPQAVSSMKVVEEVFEWQSWNRIDRWTSKPTLLPETLLRLWKEDGVGVSGNPSLFTDAMLSCSYSLDHFPLPGLSGGDAINYWEWIGGWMVDTESRGADPDGWQYGNCPSNMITSTQTTNTDRQYSLRRRKWCRVRALISVPNGSKVTQEFLKVHHRLTSMEVMCKKLSGQVLKLQTVSSEKELELSNVARLQRQVHTLYRRWQNAQDQIAKLKQNVSDLKNEARVLRSVTNRENVDSFLANLADSNDTSLWGRILSLKSPSTPPQMPQDVASEEEKIPTVSPDSDEFRDSLDEEIPLVPASTFDALLAVFKKEFEEANVAREHDPGWFQGALSNMKEKIKYFTSYEDLPSEQESFDSNTRQGMYMSGDTPFQMSDPYFQY